MIIVSNKFLSISISFQFSKVRKRLIFDLHDIFQSPALKALFADNFHLTQILEEYKKNENYNRKEKQSNCLEQMLVRITSAIITQRRQALMSKD